MHEDQYSYHSFKVNVDGSVSDQLWPQPPPLSVPVMAKEKNRDMPLMYYVETRCGVKRGPLSGQPVYNLYSERHTKHKTFDFLAST